MLSTYTTFDPGAVQAILNVGASSLPFGCGPCLWLPFKTTYTVNLTPTGLGTKTASQALTIPCIPALAGKSVQLQWTALFTTSSPCVLIPNISVSDRVDLTLDY